MRYFLSLILLAVFCVSAQDVPVQNELIINYGGGGWKNGQVHEPCVLVNPKDPKRLIMIYGGALHQNQGGIGSIGKAWANINEPFKWHEDESNPILKLDPKVPFESGMIRVDTVIYNESSDEYWIYYTGRTPQNVDAIGLVTCPAGKDGYSDVTLANIKRHAGNPILSPGGQGRSDESLVSQGAVFRENGMWYS
ncbi:MAG TPA: hypothetical protein VEK08_07010, partial [Planctomycetota bacterium]|nr:hypothetical protein [Planctomycetota bacterium]